MASYFVDPGLAAHDETLDVTFEQLRDDYLAKLDLTTATLCGRQS